MGQLLYYCQNNCRKNWKYQELVVILPSEWWQVAIFIKYLNYGTVGNYSKNRLGDEVAV